MPRYTIESEFIKENNPSIPAMLARLAAYPLILFTVLVLIFTSAKGASDEDIERLINFVQDPNAGLEENLVIPTFSEEQNARLIGLIRRYLNNGASLGIYATVHENNTESADGNLLIAHSLSNAREDIFREIPRWRAFVSQTPGRSDYLQTVNPDLNLNEYHNLFEALDGSSKAIIKVALLLGSNEIYVPYDYGREITFDATLSTGFQSVISRLTLENVVASFNMEIPIQNSLTSDNLEIHQVQEIILTFVTELGEHLTVSINSRYAMDTVTDRIAHSNPLVRVSMDGNRFVSLETINGFHPQEFIESVLSEYQIPVGLANLNLPVQFFEALLAAKNIALE